MDNRPNFTNLILDFFKRFLPGCVLFFLISGCVEPVEPEFEFKDGLIFIEAFVSTTSSASFVTVRESELDRDLRYSVRPVNEAEVTFENTDTGAVVSLFQEAGVYAPPADFAATVGESWELEVILPDGRKYRSLPEKVLAPIAISNLNVNYNPELQFNDALDRFVPGHSVAVSLDDPEDQENYYYWRFRSFENTDYCQRCTNGIFRNGICISNANATKGTNRKDYYDYLCESDCWQIRYGQDINIFDDQFTNGTSITNLPVANVLLFSKNDVVVEVQQFSLSTSAYQYYEILKDIIDNNSGFNAPPPAALVGNMFNPNNAEEFVLGRFTAAATSTRTVFIDRTDILESQIEIEPIRQFEECGEVCDAADCLPGAGSPCFEIRGGVVCGENRFRTAIAPEGWIEQ